MIVTQVTRIGHINKTIINSKMPANGIETKKEECDMTSLMLHLANQRARAAAFYCVTYY